MVITEAKGVKVRERTQNIRRKPKWKENLEKDMEKKRSDLSILTEIQNKSEVKPRKQRKIKRRYNIKKMEDIPEVKEKLKQQIQAKAQRIRRYEKRGKQLRQTTIFKENTKKFYRDLGKKQIDIDEPPTLKEIEDFWSKVWEDEIQHNETAEWIK